MSQPLIRFDKVCKTYGAGEAAVHALAGVDLTINTGEFVAVLGPSGSGKSTCMNILGALDTPTSGRYLFNGTDVGKLSRDQRAVFRRDHIGFVFQGFNLLKRTTAIENLESVRDERRHDEDLPTDADDLLLAYREEGTAGARGEPRSAFRTPQNRRPPRSPGAKFREAAARPAAVLRDCGQHRRGNLPV